jgi:transposase
MLSEDKQLVKYITINKTEYDRLLFELESLKGQLAELKRLIFGQKTERFKPNMDSLSIKQLSLFDLTDVSEEQIETKEIKYTKNLTKKAKQHPKRKALPPHLPRQEEIIEPKGITPKYKKIGEEITEVLEMIPSKLYVRKIIRPKYINTETEKIIVADLPSLPIPKGNAGASVLAHINVSKFVDHLPLYRQIQIFKRFGYNVSASTIGGWFSKSTLLLTALYEKLQQSIFLNADYLQVDESPIKVQDIDKKGKLHQGYMWVIRNPIKGLVLFKYNKGRSRSVPESLFENYNGILQTDGYKVYQGLQTKGEITLLGCMAHARRYFDKAKDNDYKRAEYVLTEIQKLYAIERKAKEHQISTDTLKRYRNIYARPILNDLEQWLKENQVKVIPKSSIGKAINYTLNLYPNLKRYIEDGRYEIDNNMIENTIRPLALGRKNYLFAGSHDAAQGYAMMYSFFATCKINNINPYEWLFDVFNNIQDYKINKLEEILPQNWKLPHN